MTRNKGATGSEVVVFLEGVAKHLVKPTSLDLFQEGCALTDVHHSSIELAKV